MIHFKDFTTGLNCSVFNNPSVQVTFKKTSHTLYLKFDSKDVVTNATYSGSIDPWLGSLCTIVIGKTLFDLTHFSWKDWDKSFEHDQIFWDLKADKSEDFFFPALELLRAALDVYRGRDYHYLESGPLICRCFGVREKDVMDYVRSSDDPTPEGLATATKAGMGCRSCVSQLTKWLSISMPKGQNRFYKEKSRAHWILEIDYMLSCFPEAAEWNMEVKTFHGSQVMIEFNKDVSQREEEEVSIRLQDFLGAALDSDLSFFLTRAPQRL